MIRVLSVMVGNANEAFIEKRISDGINIIFSDDNNKGKTITAQSLMFAMGSDPVFPPSFEHKNYYCITTLETSTGIIKVLRRKDVFVVNSDDGIRVFDSQSDFKRFWNDRITELPVIVKGGREHLVSLSLFNQMFFVIQDGRVSSKIVGDGFYNKGDFVEMLYSMAALSVQVLSAKERDDLKATANDLKSKKKALQKQATILSSQDQALAIISPTADRHAMDLKVQELDALNDQITELRKSRNRSLTRLKKNESVLLELRALDRTVGVGELVCLDCGSDRIGYRTKGEETTFDITTTDIRQQIISSVDERIASYRDELEKTEYALRQLQKEMNELMKDGSVSILDVMAYREEYRGISEIDYQIVEIDRSIADIEGKLNTATILDSDIKDAKKVFMEGLLERMSEAHKFISNDVNIEPYKSIFTTSSTAYSGSEATEYFICRTFSLSKELQHGYPIVIDSFRAEDLSTSRERLVLDLLAQLPNQIILTTTIKDEEHDKYSTHNNINVIDYSAHKSYKLLGKEHLKEFLKELEDFGIVP
ncbi:MAG: hypothetical protein LBC35_04295 [Coriobacteriales bacterium]|jgi:hypothetical protein|nr:hypothetical protein [Coriobacteriales bacterium]